MATLNTACASLPSPLHQTTPPTSPVDSDSCTSEDENKEMALAKRLVSAVESLIATRLANNVSSDSEGIDADSTKPQPSRASTLAYKRVKET
ncbi:hypothetical protein FOMA001_g15943 [Fusarium oxysporum f. sp. matthiolae]|nr:hypothetical protein FOMA001_g15943 [Fusarium oxysporum f. sp. matthiolae]